MLSIKEKKILKKQLNAVQGQIKAVANMIANDRDVEDIYIQFKAIEGIIDKALYHILDEVFSKNLANSLVQAVNDCPGECDNCGRLEILKRQFGAMDLKEVFKQLNKLNSLTKNS